MVYRLSVARRCATLFGGENFITILRPRRISAAEQGCWAPFQKPVDSLHLLAVSYKKVPYALADRKKREGKKEILPPNLQNAGFGVLSCISFLTEPPEVRQRKENVFKWKSRKNLLFLIGKKFWVKYFHTPLFLKFTWKTKKLL